LTGHCVFFLYMRGPRTSVLLPSISFLHSLVWQRHTEKGFSIESYNCTWNCSITHSQTMSSWPSMRPLPTARVVSSTHFPVRFHVYLFYQTPRRHFHHPYLDQTIRRLTTPFSVLHFEGTRLHGGSTHISFCRGRNYTASFPPSLPLWDQTMRRLTSFSFLHFGTKLHGVTLLCTCAPLHTPCTMMGIVIPSLPLLHYVSKTRRRRTQLWSADRWDVFCS
jgi:hypothetical protein